MAMDSETKYMTITCIAICMMLSVVCICDSLVTCSRHDTFLVEKQIELEKLKQQNNQVKAVKENDIQRQDKNKSADNKPGL